MSKRKTSSEKLSGEQASTRLPDSGSTKVSVSLSSSTMSKSMASFEKLGGKASTKLPDSEVASQAEENDSDMETNISRRSKSIPFNKKPISGQAKQIRRALI